MPNFQAGFKAKPSKPACEFLPRQALQKFAKMQKRAKYFPDKLYENDKKWLLL